MVNLVFSFSFFDSWVLCMGNGIPTDLLYLDFSKALDRISSKRFAIKVDHLGIRGDLIQT